MPIPDLTYQTKNYRERGGARWVIGGDLRIVTGGTLTPESGTQAADPGALIDNTGGVAALTFAAITAGSSYAQADMVAVKNALAELVLEINALRTALINLGAIA